MAFRRLLGSGRLSEYLGEKAIKVDKIFRELDMKGYSDRTEQRVHNLANADEERELYSILRLPIICGWDRRLRSHPSFLPHRVLHPGDAVGGMDSFRHVHYLQAAQVEPVK